MSETGVNLGIADAGRRLGRERLGSAWSRCRLGTGRIGLRLRRVGFLLRRGGLDRNLLACKHSFANRIVNLWNSLPEQVVSAPSINAFKTEIDRHMETRMDIYDDSPARLDVDLQFSFERYLY